MPPSSIDPEQYKALQAFKEECKTLGLYATYADLPSFQREFKQHLDIELNAPRFRWLANPETSKTDQLVKISEDATRLLLRAARSKGTALTTKSIGDSSIWVEKERFADGTPRSAARWKGALEELTSIGYIKQSGPGASIFEGHPQRLPSCRQSRIIPATSNFSEDSWAA